MDGNRNDFQNQCDEHELQLCDTSRAAQSGAVGAANEVLSVPDDPRLLALIDTWPTLPDDARDAIVRLAGLCHDDVVSMPAGKVVSR